MRNTISPTSMLLVFEGPDGLGKTTMAKAMATVLRASYVHMTATPGLIDAMPDYQATNLENIRINLEIGNHTVVDRMLDSEDIYGSVLRPETFKPVSSELYDKLYAMDPFIIFVMRDSVEEAVELHKANLDSDHPYEDGQYREIYDAYETRCHNYAYGVNVLRYVVDFNDEPAVQATKLIALIVKKLAKT